MTTDVTPRTRYPRLLTYAFGASLALTACGLVTSLVVPLVARGADAVAPFIATAAGLLLMSATLRRAQAIREGRTGAPRSFDDRVGTAHMLSAGTLLACLTLALAWPAAMGWPVLSVMCAATATSLSSSVYLTFREHRGLR